MSSLNTPQLYIHSDDIKKGFYKKTPCVRVNVKKKKTQFIPPIRLGSPSSFYTGIEDSYCVLPVQQVYKMHKSTSS